MDTFLTKVSEVIASAKDGTPLGFADGVFGYSGDRLITLLKRACESLLDDDTKIYLEIGVYRGLTLLSVGDHLKQHCANRSDVYGIDNFSQFDADGKNQSTVREGMARLGLDHVHLINQDYEDALLSLPDHVGDKKIGVFFIDGPHDYRSQLMCLQMALPHLADDCLIVIDDCNYRHVRLATKDFLLCTPEFKLAFEAYTECHPKNASEEKTAEFRTTWWDGINVIVRDRDNVMPPLFPETGNARNLCENEHGIHASRFGNQMNRAMSTLRTLANVTSLKGCWNLLDWARLVYRSRLMSKNTSALFEGMNTYSGELPEAKTNPYLVK